MRPALGHVWLVGAGPGDPGLITARALEALRTAEVVIYDRLVSKALLEQAPDEAILVDAGKRAGAHTLSQDEINALLVEHGQAGRRVVRLKGGDPFVFGRGGEEALALAEAGVPCSVVPGVSSAVGGVASAGIPVTHRGLSSSFAVVSGHSDAGELPATEAWSEMARSAETFVVLMGASRIEALAAAVVAAGRDPMAPAAVVEWATTPRQRALTATLGEIGRLAREANIGAPALVAVGRSVALAEKLSAASLGPLVGCRVLITRPEDRGRELGDLLTLEGAAVTSLPLIGYAPGPATPSEVAAAVDAMCAGAYRWVVFTSVRGVDLLFDALAQRGLDARAFAGARICAVGPATAGALRAARISPDLVPAEGTGAAAGAAIAAADPCLARSQILLARAAAADRGLPDGLAAAGAVVHDLALYAVAPVRPDDASLRTLREGQFDVLSFASPSAVRSFATLVDPGDVRRTGAVVAALGPSTAAAAAEAGLAAEIVAAKPTPRALVAAIRTYFAWKRKEESP